MKKAIVKIANWKCKESKGEGRKGKKARKGKEMKGKGRKQY